MKVTLYRPDPPDGPWMLVPPIGEPAFVYPPAEVTSHIEGQNGQAEAALDAEGEWTFPLG